LPSGDNLARTTLGLFRPIFHRNPRALPKHDLLFRLRRDGGPIRGDRHAMIIEASEALDNAVSDAE
jgi:hypothetical protein